MPARDGPQGIAALDDVALVRCLRYAQEQFLQRGADLFNDFEVPGRLIGQGRSALRDRADRRGGLVHFRLLQWPLHPLRWRDLLKDGATAPAQRQDRQRSQPFDCWPRLMKKNRQRCLSTVSMLQESAGIFGTDLLYT